MNWNELAPSTDFLLHKLHYASLLFMIVAYTIKVRQVLHKAPAKEGTPAKGEHSKGIRYSYMVLAMPWEMESSSKHWFRWLEFAMFHVAMGIAIGVAFVMPWGHGFMNNAPTVYALQGIFAVGALIGLSRMLRRIFDPAMRAISTPDDYFCVLLLILWSASGVMMVPQSSEFWLVAFFGLATFFLFYVPFSKISHYVFWFFTRYYIGKHWGHRGVFPKKRVADKA